VPPLGSANPEVQYADGYVPRRGGPPPDHRAEGATPGFHFAVTRMLGENCVAPGHYADIENSSELPAAGVQLA
jgi:hypothetical protein